MMKLTQSDLAQGDVLVSPQNGASPMSFVVETAHHHAKADEPVAMGGDDTGLAPFDFLAASLATCTAMTLRYYAKHKGIELGDFQIKVTQSNVKANVKEAQGSMNVYNLTRHLIFPGVTDEARLAKYKEIAEKCPVHKALQGDIVISTLTAS